MDNLPEESDQKIAEFRESVAKWLSITRDMVSIEARQLGLPPHRVPEILRDESTAILAYTAEEKASHEKEQSIDQAFGL